MPRFSNTPQRKRSSDVIQRTKRLLAALQSRHRRLQMENQQLQREESLLQACCDCVDWLRQQDGVSDSHNAAEQQLLQQLGLHPVPEGQQAPADNKPWSPLPQVADNSISTARTATDSPRQEVSHPTGSSTCTDSGGDSGGNRTSHRSRDSGLKSSRAQFNAAEPVAPANDCMRVFKKVLSPGLMVGVQHVTMDDIHHDYVAAVKELSLNYQLYEAQMESHGTSTAHMWPQGQQPLHRMEAIICRLLRLWWSLVAVNRQEVVQQLALTNYVTGDLLTEPDKAHHSWVVSQLGLSAEQKQRIAAGFSLFRRILAPALEELKQLQLQLQALDTSEDAPQQQQQPLEEPGGSSGLVATSSKSRLQAENRAPGEVPIHSAGGNFSPSLSAALGEASAMSCKHMPLSQWHAAHRNRLAEQEQRYQRMYTLMRKDMFHRAVLAGYMYGCLSYCQQAKMLCLMYPYAPAPVVVGQVVFEQVQLELQQRPPSRPPRQPQQRTKQPTN